MRETCRRIGIEFDQWQQDLNKCLLAKDANGLYAADTAVMSIPRQVGKTYDVGAVAFALCIAIPGLTVVWTAHRFKVARESFNEMRAWAKSSELAPHIEYDDITTAAGNECIPFRNASRIVFAARERGAIRGFTKVGMLVLDEAQILTDQVLADLVPTTNQAPNPLIILMGTPPKPTDPGEVFTRLRQEALDGESSEVLYVELSADRGADPNDRKQWKIANPSYPKRTPARAILRMRKLLSRADFMREGLGIWDDPNADDGRRIVNWPHLADAGSSAEDPVAFAVDIAVDRSWAAIGTAGRRDDGRKHVEVVDYQLGTDWLIARMLELNEKWKPCAWALDPGAPAGALVKPLTEAGLTTRCACHGERDVMFVVGRDKAQACGGLYDDAENDRLRHRGQPHLDLAIDKAATKSADDAWVFSRRESPVDISPLMSVTLAGFALEAHGRANTLEGSLMGGG